MCDIDGMMDLLGQLIMAHTVIFLLYSPDELNVTIPGQSTEENVVLLGKTAKPSWFDLWKIPAVPEIAATIFCMKTVRYAMYMWLPLFLLDYVGYTKAQAGLFSSVFEIGGVFGSATVGLVIDRLFKGRTLVGVSVSVLLSAFATLAFLVTSHWGVPFNAAFLLLAGAFNCGPDTMLTSSVPMDFGEANGRAAGAAVIGLVNGFGSFGTFLEGPFIGLLIKYFSWDGAVVALIGISFIGTFTCWRAARIRTRTVIRGQQEESMA